MRKVGLVLLCLLVGAVGASVGGARSVGHAREAIRVAPRPAKTPHVDSHLAARHFGMTRVEITARRPLAARALIVRSGGRVQNTYGHLLEAVVPAGSLHVLAKSNAIRFLGSPARPVPERVRGQGVLVTKAASWQKAGARGDGEKIAIVDLGFYGYKRSQDNGELPASIVKVNYCGAFDATDHGTAVAEIASEMAPAAKLYLICIRDVAGLGRAVDYAIAHGIRIVSHSVSWFNTSRGDGTGGPDTPDGIVAAARAAGILWVNAAGNRGQQHWSGPFTDANANGWEDFAPGDEGNTIVLPNGATTCVALKWDDWPASSEDYDLFITRSPSGAIVASSTSPQDGTEPPTELACQINVSGYAQTYAIAIHAARTTAKPVRFDLYVYPGPDLEHRVVEGSITEPASSAAALTVGAVCWQTPLTLEPYSSQGPTVDGRVKPDLVAPDSVSSFVYGPFSTCGASGFAGTSASAPHVAGAAALVKQANPSFGPDELQAYLEQNASDLGEAGKDNAFGSGALLLSAAPRLPLRNCVVPRVVGRRTASARAEIERAGCRVGRIRRARTKTRAGRVAKQRPRAGTRVRARGKVSLTISSGLRR